MSPTYPGTKIKQIRLAPICYHPVPITIYHTCDMCMSFTLAQYIVYVNIYYKYFYVYKTVAYIHPVLYHIYRHLKNDHICEIGRFFIGRNLFICHKENRVSRYTDIYSPQARWFPRGYQRFFGFGRRSGEGGGSCPFFHDHSSSLRLLLTPLIVAMTKIATAASSARPKMVRMKSSASTGHTT